MADRQLTMLLTFEADTNKAKKEIADLASSLKSIAAIPAVGSNVNTEKLREGSQAAKELLHHLQAAVNTDTGKLNLASFASSLKQSGKTLEDYKRKLENCGPAGQEAFLKVARSVVTAENPVRRLNKTFGNLLTTLKNTAKWQLSSMMIHGFMSALQSAYGYAQDLNKSLTNIRIVTGQSAEQMEVFALKANKAAKELSASTLAYTDAALIYYQQGLDDKAVKARTDVTVKMMNVTGKSAEEISSQMTAIWNNFDDGTKSLEYYADAITALGASTASSSKEIAEGLQKFAAVADTVGLSYEYATAALATVVAETRQSADIVGTAFKTLFSRLEGLKLGETLEDGVDLNKYSAALQTVSVNILDANGDLREMDTILDDLGERWKALNSAQQVALAQTVGGVRQYQQFIALMDNWDKVQKNVEIATNSEGTLQKQADIYADSWEGAKQRVQASLQSIYTSIIDDKAFINMTNGISKILEGVNGLIKGFGGIEGILLTIANIFAQRYAKEVPAFLERVKENLLIISGKAAKIGNELQNSMLKNIQEERDTALRNADNLDSSDSMTQAAEMEVLNQIGQKRAELNARSAEYSEAERQQIETEIALLEKKGQAIINSANSYDESKNQAAKLYSQIVDLDKVITNSFGKTGKPIAARILGGVPKDFAQAYTQMKKFRGQIQGWSKELERTGKISTNSKQKIKKMFEEISNNATGKTKTKLNDLIKDIEKIDVTSADAGKAFKEAFERAGNIVQDIDLSTLNLPPEVIEQLRQAGLAFEDMGKKSVIAHESMDNFGNSIPPMIQHTTNLSEGIVSLAGGLMQYTALLSSATRIGDVFTNEDATVIEKITQVISFLTTGVFAYMSLIKGLKTLNAGILTQEQAQFALKNKMLVQQLQANGIDYTNLSIKQLHKLANDKLRVSESGLIAAKTGETVAVEANTAAWYSNPITAVIAIALAAVVAVISIVTSAIKANTESVKENAQAEIDRNKKTQEEIKNNKELLKNYRELYKANKDKLKASKELADAARDVAKAYKIENAEVLIAQGRYEELNRRIAEAREQEMKLGEASTASAQAGAFSLFSDKMHEDKGAVYNGYNVGAHNFRTEIEVGWSTSDEDAVGLIEAAKKLGFGQTLTGDLYIEVENTEEGLLSAYEHVQQLTENLRVNNKHQISKLQDSSAYQNMLAFLKNSEETYKNLVELRDESLMNILDNQVEKDFKQFDNNIVNNLKEYEQVKQDLISILKQNGKNEQEAEKLVKSYLSTDTNLSTWHAIDQLAASKEGFAEWYDSLSDEQKTLVPLIRFDNLNTAEEWNNALLYAENHSRVMQVHLQLTNSDTALEEFTEANKKSNSDERTKALGEWYDKYAKTYEIDKVYASKEFFTKQSGTDSFTRSVTDMLSQNWATWLTDLHPTINLDIMSKYTEKKDALDEQGRVTDQAYEDYIAEKNKFEQSSTNSTLYIGGKEFTLPQNLTAEEYSKVGYAGEGYIKNINDIMSREGYRDALKMGIHDAGEGFDEIYEVFWDSAKQYYDVKRKDNGTLTEEDQDNIRRIKNNTAQWTGPGSGVDSIFDAMARESDDGRLKTFFNDIQKGVGANGYFWASWYDIYEFLQDFQNVPTTASTYLAEHENYTEKEQNFNDSYGTYNSELTEEVSKLTDISSIFVHNLSAMTDAVAQWTDEQIITANEYAGLEQILKDSGINIEDYFIRLSDGTYQLVGNIQELQSAVDTSARNMYKQNVLDITDHGDEFDVNTITKDQGLKLLKYLGFDENLVNILFDDDGQLREVFNTSVQAMIDKLKIDQNNYKDAWLNSFTSLTNFLDQPEILDTLDSEQVQNKLLEITKNELNNIKSLEEFNSIRELSTSLTDIPYEFLSTALINLASQYNNCTAEIQNYQNALQYGNPVEIEIAEEQLRAATLLGEAAKKYGLDANELELQAKALAEFDSNAGFSAETIAQLAVVNQRMNKGIDTLSSNLDDWTAKLKKATKGSMDYAEVASDVENALKDLLGLTDNFTLPDDFLDSAENLELLKKAANGDQVAINKLGVEIIQSTMDLNNWNAALINAYKAAAANNETMNKFSMSMEEAYRTANKGMSAILDNITALTNGTMTLSQALGTVDLDETSWIESLNQMAIATGMSVEEMRATLNSLGVQANIRVDHVKQQMEVPTYTDVVEEGEKVMVQQGMEADGVTPHMVEYTGVKHYTVPGEPKIVEGWVDIPQIAMNDNLNTPNITENKITFTGVGGGKSGGGISHSKTTSGKKNKSGGSKEKKDKKSAEKETERYHEITALIEDYTRELDKAGKAKDRAFGPKKLKAMQAEIAAQAQLNAATEEHIREIREWLEIDKARIAAQGATFDEYGNISNYTALMQQHIDAYNAAVAAYNASGQSDLDKNRFEAAEKAYQDFMDQLSQYEETNDLLQEKLDELIEAQQAKYDKEFEMLQYTIEFKIEADDSILSYLDYMKNKIENFNDGVHDAVEMLATLNDEASTLMNKNSTYNRAIDDTLNHYLSNKGMGESDIEAFIERFKSNNMSESDMSMLEDMTEAEYQYLLELKDNLLEINNSLIENMNAVVETVQNSFSKTAEDLDKATRPIERAASALENYAAIIDIVGRDALGITDAIAAELDNAAVAVAHSATVAAKAKVDTLQSERDEVQRLYDEAMAQGLTEMAYKWKTVLEEMDEEIASATDDFNSKWQEELTKAREAFENTVERIKQSMLDAFAGSIGSWSALKDSLEYAKTAADRFVPQYKEIYELSKLNRDIMKSIDNTSNIKNKQALRDLQKEINELEQHSGEISQYDLDNARRRYELELARLQLEEARDAKSTVRLSKDSEGNWSYVYTANQDDVEKAEQNYEDKLYAMQQANNEYINSLSDQILELEEQYAEKLAEIRLDNTMSEEERNAAIERLNAYFAEQMEYLTNEGQKAVDNNSRLFEEEWTTYHNWTDAFGNDTQARIDNQHDFMTQFGDTILGTYTGYGNFDELNAAMVQIAEEASVKMEEAYSVLQAQVATAMEAAGIDVAHFGEVVHDTVNDQIVPSAQAAEDAVVEMGKAAVDEFQKLTDGVSTWQTKYATEMQKIINKNEQLAISVNNLATAYANLVAQMYAAADAPTPKPVPKFNNSTADGYTDTGTGSSGGDGSGPGSPKPGSSTQDTWVTNPVWKSNDSSHWQISECTKGPSKGQTKKVNEGRHSWAIIGVISHGHGSSGAIPRSFDCECEICHKVITVPADKNYAMDDKGHILIPEYDTGGYTGDWNSSQGKLAILHEKELVLNKDDTKNILGTVEMVRKLSQKIDLNAQTARYAFNYHPIISDPKPIDRELQVDQTVSITAEFPNVQNRTEIEEAFTTLINQASQFANRKF